MSRSYRASTAATHFLSPAAGAVNIVALVRPQEVADGGAAIAQSLRYEQVQPAPAEAPKSPRWPAQRGHGGNPMRSEVGPSAAAKARSPGDAVTWAQCFPNREGASPGGQTTARRCPRAKPWYRVRRRVLLDGRRGTPACWNPGAEYQAFRSRGAVPWAQHGGQRVPAAPRVEREAKR